MARKGVRERIYNLWLLHTVQAEVNRNTVAKELHGILTDIDEGRINCLFAEECGLDPCDTAICPNYQGKENLIS